MYLYQEAEKFIKEQWNNTRDAQSRLNLPKLIEEQLIHDNANKDPEYFSHREGVVHSTSLSKCLRGVIHEMLGAKKDTELDARKLGVFKAGNLFEDFVIQALGDRVVHKQREYVYKYKNITLVGRSDYTINDDGVLRIGENKSVHSDSFFYREREGTLISWQNQVQLQTYMWLERILDPFLCGECGYEVFTNVQPTCKKCNLLMQPEPEDKIENPHGVFSYISKDDCTIVGASIMYNPRFVNEIIIPALEIVNDGYTTKNPDAAPLPAPAIFSDSRNQYQKNWLCTYCEYHSLCAGPDWLIEATNLVTTRNKEMKASKKAENVVVDAASSEG